MANLIGVAAPRLPQAVEPMLHEHRPGWIYQIPLSLYSPNFNVTNADDANLANQALQYLLNNYGGGRLSWGPFQYFGLSTINVPARMFRIGGSGFSTQWNFFNNGVGINSHGNEPGLASIEGTGTVFEHFVVDMTNVPSNAISTGMSIGDNNNFWVENVTIQNVTSTGSTNPATGANAGSNPTGAVGFAIDNQVSLTEKVHANVCINNCGTPNLGATGLNAAQSGGAGVLVVNSGGGGPPDTTSHMYTHDLNIQFNQQAGQNGLVLGRQGHIQNGHLKMFGNFFCPNSGTAQCAGIVLGVQNLAGGSQAGQIQRMFMDIYCEIDNTNGLSGAPTTIYWAGNAANTINRCFGRMQWLGSTNGWQNTNLPIATNGTFEWSGPVLGSDTILNQTGLVGLGVITSGSTVTYNGPDVVMVMSVSGGSATALTINGVTMPATAIPGAFPMSAGMSFSVTFTGSLNVSQYRYCQGA